MISQFRSLLYSLNSHVLSILPIGVLSLIWRYQPLLILGIIISIFFGVAMSPARADSVLGIELSPALCKSSASYRNLRQCVEGNALSVSFYRVTDRPCNAQEYRMAPVQESIISRVIPDERIRQSIWQLHGRCSGMTSSGYFRQINNISSQLRLPKELSDRRSFFITTNELTQRIMGLNKGMSSQAVSLFCHTNTRNQAVLTHIAVCYDNQGRFGRCTTENSQKSLINSCPSQIFIDGNY
ncbi:MULTISPECIES: hypothetical protein [unclassified Moraxella]|uniref:hypothetical protein n=1 Tax=unclassified Moraxella TaxID=2685852 RepID=UPI003AF85CFE